MLCAGCGKGDATLWCARCKQVYYCDKKCQRTHWKLIHRTTCGEAGAADASHTPADVMARASALYHAGKKIDMDRRIADACMNVEVACMDAGIKINDLLVTKEEAAAKWKDAYLCERECGFAGSFSEVEVHETTCPAEPKDRAMVQKMIADRSLFEKFLSHPRWSPEATDGKVPMLQMQ